MTSEEIRKRFLEFFEEKKHKVVPSSSLVPEGDGSVLFTTAGMQQFKPYYIGKADPMSDFGTLNTVSVQKCVRTSDIEEVGDERHLTFFEMLGNFSFGGYWKEEAIQYAYEFITNPKWMNLKIDYVTIFEGNNEVPKDTESEKIWEKIKKENNQNFEIKKCTREDNFWGQTGEEGPCGPTTEIYVDGIEIWNIVFNEFYQNKDKTLKPLDIKGIDTGMGLERLVKVVQKVPTVFDTDLFDYINSTNTKSDRIIADHARTAVFMISDGVIPSNTERGYVLRRLIRRAIVNGGETEIIANAIIEKYKNIYEFKNKEEILKVIKEEKEKFKPVLETAEKHLQIFTDKKIPGDKMFTLFSSKGIPAELAESLGYEVDRAGFKEEMKVHQQISKAGMEQKFKGGLGEHGEMEVKYHTATHLLHQALREVLGKHVEQKGSNITTERLRFDFSHPTKMTEEEKKKVEDIINSKIKKDLKVNKVVMKKEEAEKIGALHFFGDKYGDEVSVYYIGDSLETAYSKEFCGGPHTSSTGILGTFKISKEEAISLGIRRIKTILI